MRTPLLADHGGRLAFATAGLRRRRVLGAATGQLLTLVVMQIGCAAVPGAAAGAAVAGLLDVVLVGADIGWRHPLAVGLLSVLTVTAASVPSARVAAWRDPVTALRVP